MEFTITTPAVLLPALSLVLLAHTNRFLGLAAVIRNLKREIEKEGDELSDANKAQQVRSLHRRLNLIRNMQVLGVASMLFCVLSMFCIYIQFEEVAKGLFAGSLVLLSASLLISLKELFQSMEALHLELKEFNQ